MPTAMQRTVQTLRIKALGQELAAWSDRRLLEAFAQTGDESAFAEIVRRHGALVLGVCRRILGSLQDAEDAFQATFLVLARKAGSIAWQDSIKNWLHGVACRIAMKARNQAIKRKQKEKAASTINEPKSVAAWNDLRGILDEELGHLPEKYRLVLLLCYLEGKTRDEAAEQLGWTVGSVKGYLERGREMLKARLSKRGLAFSLTLSAGLLSGASAEAAIPAALASATAQSALLFHANSSASLISASVLNLAQGALNAMMIAKLKSAGFVTALLLFAIGTVGSVSYGTGGAAASARESSDFVAFEQEREGGKDEKKKSDELLTLIKELDLKVGTITVGFLRDGGGEDQTYSLAGKDLKVVSTFGQALKLTELAVGMRAWITLKDRDVTGLRVEHPTVPAFVSSMDAANRIVEVRAERKLSRLPVSADAKITVNGRAVPFAEIPIEQRIFITLSFDKKTILAINGNKIVPGNVVRPKEGDRPRDGDRPKEGQRPVERANVIIGTVIDIDAAKNTLSVLTGRPDDLKIQAITIGKDLKAKVFFENQPIQELTLAQLSKPAQVTINLGDDKSTVTGISVVAAATRGLVKSVDVQGKKITIVEGENRVEKTYAIDAEPYVRVDVGERRRATLEDITPRMNVILALTPDRQRVIGIMSAARRDGER
jgi:RNA polymerase sigma factor (sigma-70 family)